MALCYSIMTLDFKRFLGITNAHFWLFFSLPKIIRVRQKNRYRLNKLNNIYNGSIAIDYFFKQKKYFSQISLK